MFLNQEINSAMTSNPESKSVNIKEHEHQINKGKKTWTSPNQRESTRANTGKPTQNHTQTKPSKE